jgi:hypothetical protein
VDGSEGTADCCSWERLQVFAAGVDIERDAWLSTIKQRFAEDLDEFRVWRGGWRAASMIDCVRVPFPWRAGARRTQIAFVTHNLNHTCRTLHRAKAVWCEEFAEHGPRRSDPRLSVNAHLRRDNPGAEDDPQTTRLQNLQRLG